MSNIDTITHYLVSLPNGCYVREPYPRPTVGGGLLTTDEPRNAWAANSAQEANLVASRYSELLNAVGASDTTCGVEKRIVTVTYGTPSLVCEEETP